MAINPDSFIKKYPNKWCNAVLWRTEVTPPPPQGSFFLRNIFIQGNKALRPRAHCSIFVIIRFCCIDATRSYYSVSVQKRRGKHSFLSVHIDPSDNIYGAKDIRFCAFTLLPMFNRLLCHGYGPNAITFGKKCFPCPAGSFYQDELAVL